MNIKQPSISKEVIEYLNQVFPDACAELKDEMKDIYYKSGQRSVYRHLKQIYDNQHNNIGDE